MNIKDEKLYVNGMTCNSCEKRIEKILKKLNGVKYVKADYKESIVLIKYDIKLCSKEKVDSELKKSGYSIANKNLIAKKLEWIHIAGIIVIALFMAQLGQNSGNFNISDKLNNNVGFFALFIIGLLSSLHCVGMCGGIMMSQSITIDKGSKIENLKPALKYNIGRLISYTVIGGIAGGLGQVISLSLSGQALITFAAGAFMVLMGLNMYGFKAFRGLKLKLPSVKCTRYNKVNTPFIVGILNGLMPCGPLQSMQLYALATGSITLGAMSMFFFALGTVPLMIIFGLISNLLSQKNSNKLVKISGFIVILLGVSMASRAINLLGINTSALINNTSNVTNSASQDLKGHKAEIVDEKQIVKLFANAYGYTPREIYIQKNMTTELIIEGDRITSCNNEIIIPSMNLRKKLNSGTNIITIEAGDKNISYSCWMGMKRGTLKVVDDLNTVDDTDSYEDTPTEPEIMFYGLPVSKVATDRLIKSAALLDGIQKINVTSSSGDFEPAVIILNNTNESIINFEIKDNTNDGRYMIVNSDFSEVISNFEITNGTGSSSIPILDEGTYGIIKDNNVYSILEVFSDINSVDKEVIRKKYF